MNSDRPASLLTSSQREYLTGEKVVEQTAAERSIRSRIRDRVRAGVFDLAVLWDHLEDGERHEVFGRPGPAKSAEDAEELLDNDPELERALEDAIAFLYLATHDTGRDQRELAERAIHAAEERASPHAVDVTLEVDQFRTDYFAEKGRDKIDAGEQLEDIEIRALLEEDVVEPDRVAAYVRGEWRPDEPDK